MTRPQPPLHTVTGEVFQLVRIYYRVFNQKTVQNVFKKLHCIEFDGDRNRWVWLFEYEAKKLQFGPPSSKLSKDIQQPIVIGSFTFCGEDQMLLDVKSCERATQAIEFFDKRINRRAARVTHLRIVNKLFEPTREMTQRLIMESPDSFFDRDDVARPQEALLEGLEKLKEEPDLATRRQKGLDWIVQQTQEPLAELEEIEANFYEEGIHSLEMALKIRQAELMERWNGNQNANMFTIMQKLVDANLPELP